ncbi:hypothetical protein [Clostridium sp. C2-6-12]|uniref:hypothetical protein n=1 Tax=Clostridium sp. C2-6-12 TaxID=2698832 RepID=UPI0013718696|nr:hypothetical protein [Clostridium sp. C2-6-12]
MKNLSIDFYLKRNSHSEFITDLYRYLLELKKCVYVKIIYNPEKLEKPEVDILTKIFNSYTCEDLKDSTFYLENLYDEDLAKDPLCLEEIIKESFSEYNVTCYSSFIDSKLIEGLLTDFSYSNIDHLYKLNCNQIMFFTNKDDYESMVLGVYDFQTMFSISHLDNEEVHMIKSIFGSKFNINNLEIDIYENEIN